MTIIKSPTPAELGATILAGLNAYRFLPEAGSYPEAERARLEQGASDRLDAKQALRELVVRAETFGWPEQLPYETREEFVARRTAELDEVDGRVKAARAALAQGKVSDV